MVHWMPQTIVSKISFWGTIVGIIMLFSIYWAAMLSKLSIPIPLGLVSIILLLIFGTMSIVSIVKYKDKAILLFVSSFFGLFAWFMVIGEFVFPH